MTMMKHMGYPTAIPQERRPTPAPSPPDAKSEAGFMAPRGFTAFLAMVMREERAAVDIEVAKLRDRITTLETKLARMTARQNSPRKERAP